MSSWVKGAKMGNNMKLSILVSFHRGAGFLKDCLDSIAGQEFPDCEVILVFDHVDEQEKKQVGEITGSFKVNPLRIFELESSTGVAAARNKALDEAAGDYVLFLDSDDYLADSYLRLMSEAATPNTIVIGKYKKYWYGRNTYIKEQQEKSELRGAGETGETEEADIEENEALSGGKREKAIGSVLNMLIPKCFIDERGIRFEEDLVYYSDFPFVCALTSWREIAVCRQAIYIKRSHNDSITQPALSQIRDETKADEFLRSYKLGLSRLECADKQQAYVYLCSYLVREFLRSKGQRGYQWSAETKRSFAAALNERQLQRYTGVSSAEYRFLKKFRKGKIRSAISLGRLTLLWRRKRGKLGSRQQWGRAFAKFIFRRMPVKENWIMFESFLGKNYADSCKYIYEYMQKTRGDRYKYIWFLDNRDIKIPGRATVVKTYSLRYFYYISRAKYWVNNMRQPAWFIKRPGTVFLETWHGTPLKKLVFDMEEVHSASPDYKMTFYRQSRIWDYLISDNRFSTDVFERAFLFPREKILELGYPRNDILYAENRAQRSEQIKQELNIPEDKKIILYAPTWRDDEYYAPGQYKFRLPLDLGLLRSRLSSEYVLLLRMHYFIADHMEIREDEKDFVRDVSRYHDVGHLYLISDILITDYSSVFFDYANLRRPILFFVYDFEKYRDVLRGFYIDMEKELPGPLLYENEQVVDAIEHIDRVEAQYGERYNDFYEKFCSLDDGNAAARIVDEVFD